jgi:hypothetical protein
MTRAVTLAGYALLAAALAGLELAGLVWRRIPTLGDTVAALARRRAGRWVLLAGWLWLGWHLFVRSS